MGRAISRRQDFPAQWRSPPGKVASATRPLPMPHLCRTFADSNTVPEPANLPVLNVKDSDTLLLRPRLAVKRSLDAGAMTEPSRFGRNVTVKPSGKLRMEVGIQHPTFAVHVLAFEAIEPPVAHPESSRGVAMISRASRTQGVPLSIAQQ